MITEARSTPSAKFPWLSSGCYSGNLVTVFTGCLTSSLLYLAFWDHLPNNPLTLKSLSQDLLLGDSNLSHSLFKYGHFKTVLMTSSPLTRCLFQLGIPSTPLLASPRWPWAWARHHCLGLTTTALLLQATVHPLGNRVPPTRQHSGTSFPVWCLSCSGAPPGPSLATSSDMAQTHIWSHSTCAFSLEVEL